MVSRTHPPRLRPSSLATTTTSGRTAKGADAGRIFVFLFPSKRRHTRYWRDWSSDVCSSDLAHRPGVLGRGRGPPQPGDRPHRRRRHQHLPAALAGQQQPVRAHLDELPGHVTGTGAPQHHRPAERAGQPVHQPDGTGLHPPTGGVLRPLGGGRRLVELRLQVGEEPLPPHPPPPRFDPSAHQSLRLRAFACFSHAAMSTSRGGAMSSRRLLGTAAVMTAAAAALHTVTPDLGAVAAAGLDLQRAVDTAGAETVLLAGVAALAWLAWLWGALGLTQIGRASCRERV